MNSSRDNIAAQASSNAFFCQLKRRKYVFTAVVSLTLFIAGLVIGIGSTVIYFKRSFRSVAESPERIERDLTSMLTKDYNLTTQQNEELRVVVETRMANIMTVRKESNAVIRDEFESLCGEISKILGPENVESWNERVRLHLGKRMGGQRRMSTDERGGGGRNYYR